jgi:hypothetical protein
MIDLYFLWFLSLPVLAQLQIISKKQFTWSLMLNQSNANAQPMVIEPENCQFMMETFVRKFVCIA